MHRTVAAAAVLRVALRHFAASDNHRIHGRRSTRCIAAVAAATVLLMIDWKL